MSDVSECNSFSAANQSAEFDAVIVGAGFAGLYMLHRLRGLGISVRLYEAASDVGGTWYWNRYPGARCDVESLEYSYSFSEELQQEWKWSERYASQPEILRYLNHVADRFDLRRDIQFETRVTAASFDQATQRWSLQTDRGDQVSAKFCIMATGCLSAAKIPNFPGLQSFQGQWFHTGNWPHKEVDFTGQSVGIIGTGSSAIQALPYIAKQAAQVLVFQRTPSFSVPAANAPLDSKHEQFVKANYAAERQKARTSSFGFLFENNPQEAMAASPEERQREFAARWEKGGLCILGAFADLLVNKAANDTVAEFVRSRIRQIVFDPAVAEALSPKDYPLGSKRVCLNTDYYQTFNRANVRLIDVRKDPIVAITDAGIKTQDAEYALNSIVYATGFDAMTGALLNIDIRGKYAKTLREKWASGPRTYLGIMTAGFPNLFTITGPGSPSVLSNMVLSIEQHVDWIADAIAYLQKHNLASIEASADAEDAWVAHVEAVANYTLFPVANSWYVGANIAGKPRVFMPYIGGVGAYRQKCDDVAAKGYEGFALSH